MRFHTDNSDYPAIRRTVSSGRSTRCPSVT